MNLKHNPIASSKAVRSCRESVSTRPIPATERGWDFILHSMRPLVPLAAVCACLDKRSREVLALIDEGELRWAFDIRSERSHRREVRVARQSLLECAGLCDRPFQANGDAGEFDELINQILPANKTVTPPAVLGQTPPPALRSLDIAEGLACLSQHIINLTREKSLHPVPLRGGPKSSPLVTRASVIEFLRNRRMQ